MASVPFPQRPDAPMPADRWTGRIAPARPTGGLWAWAMLAILAALSFRLMPEELMLAVDRSAMDIARAAAPARSSTFETPGDTFPGSAYFFAQDAFASPDPVPAVTGDPAVTALPPNQRSPHVLQIDNGPSALSMPMRGLTFLDQARALQCMTNAIYYEAGNEPEEGQRAVAQVILNRLASGRWPASVCGVVYQGTERPDRLCQFTFSCDGSMARKPAASSWIRARRVASRILSGEVFAPVGLSTFYHTLAVHPPWAERVRPVAVIGAHIFYRMPGEAGMPASYRMRYSGLETAQPGPYAFASPPRAAPVLAPPGPDLMTAWTRIASAPAGITDARPYSPPSLPAGIPTPLPSSILKVQVATAPSVSTRDQISPSLPQSTIRPEYRNSGMVLRQ